MSYIAAQLYGSSKIKAQRNNDDNFDGGQRNSRTNCKLAASWSAAEKLAPVSQLQLEVVVVANSYLGAKQKKTKTEKRGKQKGNRGENCAQ